MEKEFNHVINDMLCGKKNKGFKADSGWYQEMLLVINCSLDYTSRNTICCNSCYAFYVLSAPNIQGHVQYIFRIERKDTR